MTKRIFAEDLWTRGLFFFGVLIQQCPLHDPGKVAKHFIGILPLAGLLESIFEGPCDQDIAFTNDPLIPQPALRERRTGYLMVMEMIPACHDLMISVLPSQERQNRNVLVQYLIRTGVVIQCGIRAHQVDGLVFLKVGCHAFNVSSMQEIIGGHDQS